MLYSINETILIKWFKNEVRRDDITLLMQSLTPPQRPLCANESLSPAKNFPLLLVHLQSILTSSPRQKIELEQSDLESGGNHLHLALLASTLPLLPVILSL